MDLQSIVDQFNIISAVYSFDILPDGSRGEIRLEAANAADRAYFATFYPSVKYYPGIPIRKFFTEYNLEDFIYRAATSGDPLYSYVNAQNSWMKSFFLPFKTDEDRPSSEVKTYYCLYFLTIDSNLNAGDMSQRSFEVSSSVLQLSVKLHRTEDFREAMVSSVAEIKNICRSEDCAIYTVDQHKRECRLFSFDGEHEEFIESFAQEMSRTPYEVAMAWEKDLDGSDGLILDDLKVVEEIDPVWYRSMCNYGIKNIILFSIRFHNNLVGFIWAANYDNSYSLEIKETLELASFLLAAVIANHQIVSHLKIMSTIDALTQVHNRNSMNDRVDKLVSGKEKLPENMGVVFADINGLKSVNDNFGHSEGDKLIKKAAALLNIAFLSYEIYRAGGDEFVVFCPNVTKEEFEGCLEQLKKLTDNTTDISIAVGAKHFSGNYDVLQAMQTVDKLMYINKEEYYKNHPEMERRRT
ncbi:MAG: sensor domain-containing diguanylate cyclase [Firmicutes bacterium]|nr:sensor domain-containing diguanylate cyclase [Bacillota bacterium]